MRFWPMLAAPCLLVGNTTAGVLPRPLAAQQPGGYIAGVVVDTLGTPIPSAHVSVGSARQLALTDGAGRFRLTGLPLGETVLTVRRIGYHAAANPVDVTATGPSQLMITLLTRAEALAPVEVSATRQVYDARLQGFRDRAERRSSGHFIERERIERAHSSRLVDLLREVPSVRIKTTRAWGTVVFLRGATCPPLVFLDGFPASAGPLDMDLIDLSTVEGIEVYSGMGSVPAEFSTARSDRCGVIAIWSKPYRPLPSSDPVQSASVVASLVKGQLAYPAEAVDQRATLTRGTLSPVYPDSLLRAGIAGRVLMRFVVDTAGQVQLETVDVSESTHPLFATAAVNALHDARFSPAVRAGRRVPQIVALPLRFAPPSP